MSGHFNFILNGKPVRVQGVSPNTTLLEWLRGSGCTGTKEGCAEGDCGACSVVVREGTQWRAFNSCLVPLPALAGREVKTVEGLKAPGNPCAAQGACGADGALHPVQAAMVKHHGSQCGYCTPGVVMSLYEAYHREDLTTEAQLDEQLAGNLCRCTGYRAICAAAREALGTKASNGTAEAGTEVETAPPTASEYIAGGESFLRPTTLAELFALRARFPEARMVAGATELGLEITKRFKRFGTLISLEAVRELTELRAEPAAWQIGAAARLTDVLDAVGPEFPAWREMLWWFGSRQIRNRATMGGNLVTASPIGDSAPVLLTCGAQLVLASPQGERTVGIDNLFVAYRKTALRADEVLKTIVVPRADGFVRRFYKVSKRREMDISTVSGCFAVKVADGVVADIRIAYGGVAATPVRARQTEAALRGKPWNAETIATVKAGLAAEFAPINDTRGSAEYRRWVVTGLLEKFFAETTDAAVTEHLSAAVLSEPAAEQFQTESTLPGLPHESGHLHVTGEARYTDDGTRGMLETWLVLSPHARARITRRDATAARTMPGIRAVLLAEDVPGTNDVGPVRHDEPLLAVDEILYHAQPVALVVGETLDQCRAAAAAVVVEYEKLPAILTVREAITQQSFHTGANVIQRGDTEAALTTAPRRLSGEFEMGGQDHFYLESQAAWARPGETMFVCSSTQHPSEVQMAVAHNLGLRFNDVVVESTRMGGGFGGKETQAAGPAVLAALAAMRTGEPVRVRYDRDRDMAITGKRHPFHARYEVGFAPDGRVLAMRAELWADGGWSLDLSRAIADRALFHLDNAYYVPAMDIRSTVAKTNLASNTAFRGFGGPQGMLVIEEIMDRVARACGLPPETVRERNLYHGTGETNTTHYGQLIEDERIGRVWHELTASSEFAARHAALTRWNEAHPRCKRGLAITPVKFGISFTTTHLNQAGALVLIYQDGTVQVNHGGTEMGQGVNSNMALIAARELGIEPEAVRVMPTRTDKVPNTSATAASCGTDLNGAAVKNACDILNERLAPFRAPGLPFAGVVSAAYLQRVSLSTTGFYRTPDIHFDWKTGRGKPFHYFAVGAAVSEVEVDGLTGMFRLLRTDILHDVGTPINPAVTRGQIEGGFVQGAGWLTCEELRWDAEGRLLTHSPDTYKIPAVGDRPRDFRVAFLTNAAQPKVIHGSKAVGEPPLMLAISVREAIRDAVAAFGAKGEIALAAPATPEAILRAIRGATEAASKPVPSAP